MGRDFEEDIYKLKMSCQLLIILYNVLSYEKASLVVQW